MNFGSDCVPVMVRIPPDPALAPEQQDWQATWPRQDYLELAAVTGAVTSARLHVRFVLKEWRAAGLALTVDQAADLELVTDELVINAVAATRSVQRWAPKRPPVRLWLLATAASAMVVTWDATTDPPVPQPLSDDAESGRGLRLIDALSGWGHYLPHPVHGGKVIHATVPKPPSRPGYG